MSTGSPVFFFELFITYSAFRGQPTDQSLGGFRKLIMIVVTRDFLTPASPGSDTKRFRVYLTGQAVRTEIYSSRLCVDSSEIISL
jgi:hypothetical protein